MRDHATDPSTFLTFCTNNYYTFVRTVRPRARPQQKRAPINQLHLSLPNFLVLLSCQSKVSWSRSSHLHMQQIPCHLTHSYGYVQKCRKICGLGCVNRMRTPVRESRNLAHAIFWLSVNNNNISLSEYNRPTAVRSLFSPLVLRWFLKIKNCESWFLSPISEIRNPALEKLFLFYLLWLRFWFQQNAQKWPRDQNHDSCGIRIISALLSFQPSFLPHSHSATRRLTHARSDLPRTYLVHEQFTIPFTIPDLGGKLFLL